MTTDSLTANDNFGEIPDMGDKVVVPFSSATPSAVPLTQLTEAEVIDTLKSMRLLNVWKGELATASNHYRKEHPVTDDPKALKITSYQNHPNFSEGYQTATYLADAMIALKHMGYKADITHTKRLREIIDGDEDPHSCNLARDTIKSYAKALALLSHEMHAGRPQNAEDRAHFEQGLHAFEREDALDPLRGVSQEAHPMYAAMYQIGDALAKCISIEHTNPDVRATALANAAVLAESRHSLIRGS